MMEQRSEAWFAARAGKVTASRISDVLARTKSGWGAGRKNYAAQLVAERLTGTVEPSYCNAAMQWGTDTEPHAREAYCQHMLCAVEEIAFVDHPTIAMAGASPDGLIGDDGLVEIKCPGTATHIETLLGGSIPDKYRLQMLFQMACTGRQYCDFVSFDPRLPETMRLFVQRLPRDDAEIAEVEREVAAFLAEIDETVAQLRARYEQELEAA
ncbi:lambda exonuclease family protein [Sphingomonas segetis]|jgi:putative phage-type endonuclease|uniref:lambda exonuclease family protein n=1 Tax=Sphingomonas segetis TaxID=1104779 RepID=UPI0012D36468|nr:lambda exonuclease family protein [Sphingomonas segetis]